MNHKEAHFKLYTHKVLKQYKLATQLSDVVSYSSKTNPLITPILEKYTSSLFSVHFKNELQHIKDCSRVFFLAQAPTQEEINDLLAKGIRRFCVDNENDLDILLEVIQKQKITIDLFLRLKLKENTIRTEKYFVFGMKSKIVNKRIQQIHNSTIRKYIDNLGIHFHRKTQNMAEWNLWYELQDFLEEETFNAIQYINIGGGLPSEYANTNIDVLKSISKKISEFKQHCHKKNIQLMIEPGRFISAPSVELVTYIQGMYENTIIVNASVYNTDMDALIVPVKLLVQGEVSKNEGKQYILKGITPCSLDLFRYKVYLQNPKIGDEIIFKNAGAYNFSTDFCDLKKLKTKVIE